MDTEEILMTYDILLAQKDAELRAYEKMEKAK